MFVKGTGWCTMDSAMDFRRERYERFLGAARDENCQLVRAWGGGMPETDDFYDLCDRLGLMVMQEWPTAWNSHNDQPADVLEETVRRNTLRLRNRPSLVMWGAGNESSAPHGPMIDLMGRLAVELDGTRPFHRGEMWGGSDHNYDCWWNRQPLDHNLNMTARFWGEFGIASLPVYESVQRYLPENEKHLWPPPSCGSFAHHLPVFNRAEELDRLRQYAGYFTAGRTMERFIEGSQLAQVVGVRHTLERERTRWPACSGALLYKLNDIFPAASWATVDWYGATKMAHWFVQDAFETFHACVLFDSVENHARELSLPVFLLDDAESLSDAEWEVRIRAYDGSLQRIKEERFAGYGSIDRVRKLGALTLTAQQTDTTPLFVVTETYRGGQRVNGTFYFVNYGRQQDSLFDLPRTTLAHRCECDQVVVTNTGTLPAVAVNVFDVAALDTFTANDNYFWLEPGESRRFAISSSGQLRVEAWNVERNRP
jgi:beta-mannosidase